MLAEGGPDAEPELEGGPDMMAAERPSPPPSPEWSSSPLILSAPLALGDGVEAAVSSMDVCGSMLASLMEAKGGSLAGRECGSESSECDVAPVLARLCFGWSVSEGERDLFRVESSSGMIRFQFSRGRSRSR